MRSGLLHATVFRTNQRRSGIVGIYAEYLGKSLSFAELSSERKHQLARIGELRGGGDVLVFASDFSKPQAPISILYTDLVPIADQLANLSGSRLDLILETPGGSGEVAEDIIRILRRRYDHIGVIIPGWAKSAGTIIAMSADEILMEPLSAVGPIDAQIGWQGKVFSAGALLEGLEKIKKDVADSGVLNKAYIPILQGISPGEIEHARNAQDFAKSLVTDCLAKYKFKTWVKRSTSGKPVNDEGRRLRAEEIADRLGDHGRWKTHGRSITLEDLRQMGLQIENYADNEPLADAIRRYHTLMRMTFEQTSVYKIFETPTSQIYRYMMTPGDIRSQRMMGPQAVLLDYKCVKCERVMPLQVNLEKAQPIQPGRHAFPGDNKLRCAHCGTEHDLSGIRNQIEMQTKKPVV